MPKMSQIREMAKGLGVKTTFALGKTELVRKVQAAEGNHPCFRTAGNTCSQTHCLWIEDCLAKPAGNKAVCGQKQAAG